MKPQDGPVEPGRDDGLAGTQAPRVLIGIEHEVNLARVVEVLDDFILVLGEHVDEDVSALDDVVQEVLVHRLEDVSVRGRQDEAKRLELAWEQRQHRTAYVVVVVLAMVMTGGENDVLNVV